ncbi:MAG TPA: adenylate cyclase [Dehalococcoidia bacterium]|nr:adenylate cyclase [Dehalococcoidia bacterium]
MVTASPTRTVMSDEEVSRLLGLIKGADSVELKITVDVEAHQATIAALGIDPLDARIRQVFFLDTPDQRLRAAGLIVRTRRIQGKRGDSTVKVRPVVPAELPPEVRKLPDFGIEVDAMPGGFVCSASLNHALDNSEPRDAAAGKRPRRKLFSKDQRAFFSSHAPEGIALDDLAMMGPFFVLKAKWTPDAGPRSMTAEMWLYPDGSRVLELSTKCLPGEAFQVAAEARAYLIERGVSLTGEQVTKTQKALEFFAASSPRSEVRGY